MKKLKYNGYSIVMQEVPNEVSLAINISGCPHRCEGCHSEYLWRYEGDYISDDLETIIQKYKDLITCVCFMGGDQNPYELSDLLNKVHGYGLKTALYTGEDSLQHIAIRILSNLDYCKIGHYNKTLGGLNNKNTNQKMLLWNKQEKKWEDITYLFQKRGET